MQKQKWSIILLLITLILLSLFFGQKYIHEGNTGNTSAPGAIFTGSSTSKDIESVRDDYNNVNAGYIDSNSEANRLNQANKNKEKQIEDSARLIDKLTGDISYNQMQKDNLFQKVIQNSYVSAVVNLPLRKDAINIASDLGISDEANTQKQMDFDMNGNPTIIKFTTKDGKECAFFKYDKNNQNDTNNSLYQYISFRFKNPKQFSFCIWIYIDLNDNDKYTVVSITNKNNLSPSVQLDVERGNIMIFCALTNVPIPIHSKKVYNSGWVFVTYTYDSNANSSMYINRGDLVSSSPSNGIFQKDNILYRPNYFFIGRSGDINRGYNGYVHDFNYYAFTLPPKDVIEMYDYTLK